MSGEKQDPAGQNGPPPDPASPRWRLLAWAVAVLTAVTLGCGVWLWQYAARPADTDQTVVVRIPRGLGSAGIGRILAGQGLVADDIRFQALALLTGKSSRLKAGEYRIPPHSTPLQILSLLESGKVVVHQLTIPEGLNIRQISKIIEEKGWGDQEHFVRLTRDRNLISSLGLRQENLEGYLFPDTYRLTLEEISPRSIIVMMVRRFQAVWQEISAGHSPILTTREVVTLASIVEKETGAPEERPVIAGVFLNRLRKNMRLQSDPTVIYGMDSFNGKLTRADLRQETPYNTYVIKGLPPGPICNPGRAALEAVLQPAETDYLYFVSRNDGTHQFSENLEEHNRAVRRFRKNRERPRNKAGTR